MTVGIIGLGLIGGSMALDLRKTGFADELIGVESDPANASLAARLGLVDRLAGYEECLSQSDVVVLAVPSGVAEKMLPDILDRFAAGSGARDCRKIVTDVCSVKERLAGCVQGHPLRGRYVAAHPMAGTEYSGPSAAVYGLFDGHACIICDGESSSGDAVGTVSELFSSLGMRLLYMAAEDHDVHAAYVSHISHVTSFALALTVLDKEKDERHIFDLASGGFSSTVRLAKSSPDMWTPVLAMNRDNVLEVMDTYMSKMRMFRDAVASGDNDAVHELIARANIIRRIIK